MVEFGINLIDTRRVERKFDAFPQQAHDKLLARITSLTAELHSRVQSAAPNLTGKLRGTIVTRMYDDNDRLRGRVTVTTDFAKAATLEYGSHKTIMVNLPPGAQRARQGHRSLRADSETRSQVVGRSFTRQLNIVARRFMRGPLQAMSGRVIAEINAALQEAADES